MLAGGEERQQGRKKTRGVAAAAAAAGMFPGSGNGRRGAGEMEPSLDLAEEDTCLTTNQQVRRRLD
jgi:hypothetical protein